MECCNICCRPFQDDRPIKELSCSHVLCESCYLRLDKTHCPFCRDIFTYSQEDLNKRNKLNLNYTWQPPSQIYNYIPPENNSNLSNNSNVVTISNNARNRELEHNVPFSRARKNMNRRRRRTLSFDEVLERRQMIRKRSRMKWMKKEGRLAKINSSNYDED